MQLQKEDQQMFDARKDYDMKIEDRRQKGKQQL